jgi:hypothetical protein
MLMNISLNKLRRNVGIVPLTVRSAQLTIVACNVVFELCCVRIISTRNDGELNEMVTDCNGCLVNNGMWMNE